MEATSSEASTLVLQRKDTVSEIAKHLPWDSFPSCSQVCKLWKDVFCDPQALSYIVSSFPEYIINEVEELIISENIEMDDHVGRSDAIKKVLSKHSVDDFMNSIVQAHLHLLKGWSKRYVVGSDKFDGKPMLDSDTKLTHGRHKIKIISDKFCYEWRSLSNHDYKSWNLSEIEGVKIIRGIKKTNNFGQKQKNQYLMLNNNYSLGEIEQRIKDGCNVIERSFYYDRMLGRAKIIAQIFALTAAVGMGTSYLSGSGGLGVLFGLSVFMSASLTACIFK